VIAFGTIRKDLRIFLERSLNERERKLLLECYRFQGDTFSSIVSRLSSIYPESTAKLVLRRLKSFNLVDFGNINEKGKSLVLTPLGKKFKKILVGDSNE